MKWFIFLGIVFHVSVSGAVEIKCGGYFGTQTMEFVYNSVNHHFSVNQEDLYLIVKPQGPGVRVLALADWEAPAVSASSFSATKSL